MRSSLASVYWFHGHICPMSTLGFRAGKLAKKLLNLKRQDYRFAVAKVYYKSCATDGIQISFPATYGNGNLIVLDEQKMKFEFINTETNHKVELTFTEKLYKVMNEYLSLRKLLENNNNKDLNVKYKNFLRFTQTAKVEDIFIIQYNDRIS